MIRCFLPAILLLAAHPAAAQQVAAAAPSLAPPTAGAAAAETRGHLLQGRWIIQRLDQGTRAEIRVNEVFPARGVTNVSGVLMLGPGVGCPVTGSVIDDLTAEFSDEPETRRFPISAFVTFRARCGDREYWIEALGLPSGSILMNGRMTEISRSGRGFVAVSIGR